MKCIRSNTFFGILLAMAAAGVLLAVTGSMMIGEETVESVAGHHEKAEKLLRDRQDSDVNDSDSRETGLRSEFKTTLHGGLAPVEWQAGGAGHVGVRVQDIAPEAPAAERGATIGEMMRWAGIFSIIGAIGILIFIEFIYKGRIRRTNYRLLLIISLFVLPLLITLSTSTTVLETTKSVESCASCHVMDPFVNDLYAEESTTLAARHYKNRWIPVYQCYTCHTTYGAHGTIEGKRDGFRHWLLFVTRTWEEPISYSGSYPNMNCTACHGGTRDFMDVPSHQALSAKLRADEVSCTSCHGPAHPTPAEREDVPERTAEDSEGERQKIDSGDLARIMEMFYE